MTGILSTISGFFSKPLILGIFLPTVIFIAFFFLLAVPLLPDSLSVLKQLEALDTQWKVISVSFTTVVLSGFFYNLNIPIIRLYEGYPWRRTWLGKWRVKHHRERFRVLRNQQRGMRMLLRAMVSADQSLISGTYVEIRTLLESDPKLRSIQKALPGSGMPSQEERWGVLREEITSKWGDISRQLINEFPGKEQLVLPTVLGNVIRSFEYYPDQEYGIDAVTLWPRLIAKIDRDYAASIDDAKTSFDFMINCSLLSAMLALIVLFIGLWTSAPLANWPNLTSWLFEIFALTTVSYLSYWGAINRAPAWGVKVKSAFDLYRNDLLVQLGFSDKPKTKRAERELWDNISQQMVYGDLPSGPNVDYPQMIEPTVPTYAVSKPPGVTLEVKRTIKQASGENMFEVLLAVRNVDSSRTPALQVVVTDTLSIDWAYQWGSAAPKESVEGFAVSGSNPYRFSIGNLEADEEKTVSYRAYWRQPSQRS